MSQTAPHAVWENDDLILRLRLTPQSSRDQVLGLMGDRLKIAITAPPVDGKANKHLVKLLSKCFRVPKSSISFDSGETDRNKTLRIEAPTVLPEAFLIPPPDAGRKSS